MLLELETSNLDAYLEASDVIDFEQPITREIAAHAKSQHS
jgi:hypothetical protein